MKYFNSAANLIPQYNEYKECVRNPGIISISGLSRIHKAHFIAATTEETSESLLVLVDSESEAERLCADVNTLCNNSCAYVYPAKDSDLFIAEAASGEYVHRRLSVLYSLTRKIPTEFSSQSEQGLSFGTSVIVATPEAAAQLTISPKKLTESIIRIEKDGEFKSEEVFSRLIEGGYSRVDMVESVSQFSVRGSIIDIFPVNSELPVRVDLWGDTVDSLALFDVESQRSVSKIEVVHISPSCEQLEDSTATLFDYVQKVIVCEQNACNEQFRSAYEQFKEDLALAAEQGNVSGGKFMLSKAEYNALAEEKTFAYFDAFARKGREFTQVAVTQLPPWNGEYNQLCRDLKAYMKSGYSVIIFAGTEKSARELANDLRDDDFVADYAVNPERAYGRHIFVTAGTLSAGYDYSEAKCACITLFGNRNSETVVRGITGGTSPVSAAKKPKRKSKAEAIRAISEINVGDYIVHDNYGIGIFEGVTKLTNDGISKDYIKLRYAGKDALYLPVTQLDFIARYIGNTSSANLKLSKLHTDTWFKTKAKVKRAVAELAQELVELYSVRMKAKGHSFGKDTPEQLEFESRFSYVETDDQLTCIEELKSDMQSPRPMDRLLCGDVGFGKTEVALRGAFKCVMEGKQCALLCPTTVLAWQHYQTAIQRFGLTEGVSSRQSLQKRNDNAGLVNVELLSRFRTPKQQKEILQKLESGVIDFIIGTHTLVGKNVKFKNLGLVIIDEEQRFGVMQKERLKVSFEGVDTLTLSATPIPRTLNMAMSGIRDMSVIETPPHDRLPVTTYVIEHDYGVISAAINKELRRAGQVYYIHNRVETIMSAAAKLQGLLPDARIGIAHGKMDEKSLLEVWRQLLERQIDILVCTTLIETGVDVPNVNTLIIENADRMGLAQLHQLRGRVGRTNRRAFAYFTFNRGKVLTEIAEKRLKAVREFTQFGAGFKIALRDLEIRGAGSVLGESQSGHLSSVGYETYVRLLEEAVKSVDGGRSSSDGEESPSEVVSQCVVDVKADAFIPDGYISNQSGRIACYKKIAEIRDEDDAKDVVSELTDRYGKIPKPVTGLIQAARIRNLGGRCGISEVSQNKNGVVFHWRQNVAEESSESQSAKMEGLSYWERRRLEKGNQAGLPVEKLSKLPQKLFSKMELNLTERPGVTLKLTEKDDVLDIVTGFLENLVDN
ncbi:MAG: transcription-repair coupling factor [Oscillospiraceae bacterium]|nr:transcription-repair coupling factor [Oscillospiraceae bacterium]